jgi:hypothetical protein
MKIPITNQVQEKISISARAQRSARSVPIPIQIRATARPPYTAMAGAIVPRSDPGAWVLAAITMPNSISGTKSATTQPRRIVATPKIVNMPDRSV